MRIALLLESLDYYLDDFALKPRKTSGGSGAGAERKVICPRCEGIGRERSGNRCGQCAHGSSTADHTCETCKNCKGRGRVFWNSYLGQVEGTDAPSSPRGEGKAKAKRASIDARTLGEEFGYFHRILTARTVRDRSGSYKALERALRALRTEDEIAYYLVNAFYREQRWGRPQELLRPSELVGDQPRSNIRLARLGFAESVALARGMVFLDKRMPKDIFVPREILAPIETREGKSVTAQAGSKSGRARSRARRWAA